MSKLIVEVETGNWILPVEVDLETGSCRNLYNVMKVCRTNRFAKT